MFFSIISNHITGQITSQITKLFKQSIMACQDVSEQWPCDIYCAHQCNTTCNCCCNGLIDANGQNKCGENSCGHVPRQCDIVEQCDTCNSGEGYCFECIRIAFKKGCKCNNIVCDIVSMKTAMDQYLKERDETNNKLANLSP